MVMMFLSDDDRNKADPAFGKMGAAVAYGTASGCITSESITALREMFAE